VGDASVGRRAASRARPTTFEWLEGGAFLIQHADVEPAEFEIPPEFVANSPFPLVTVTGLDEETGGLCMPYADARVPAAYPDEPDRRCLEDLAGRPGVLPALHRAPSAATALPSPGWEASSDGSDWTPTST
jgi:hypothetical protein